MVFRIYQASGRNHMGRLELEGGGHSWCGGRISSDKKFTPLLAPESVSGLLPLSFYRGKSNRLPQRGGFSRLRDFFFILDPDLYFL